MNTAADVLATVFTYRVEIQHVEEGREDWAHIHGLDWETTTSYADARIYAIRVRDDHPGARVRIVETADGYPNHFIDCP